jgi:proteic killer suppression protein
MTTLRWSRWFAAVSATSKFSTDVTRKFVRRFKAIERQALRKLDMLDAAQDIRTLSRLLGNRLESLRGDRKGQYSMRVNDQWRVCFEWRDGHAYEVEIVDYH